MAGLYQSMTIKPTTTGHPPTCASLMTLSRGQEMVEKIVQAIDEFVVNCNPETMVQPLVDSNMIDIPQADSIPLQEPATAESCSSSADYIPDPSTYVHPMLTRSKAVNGDNGWIVYQSMTIEPTTTGHPPTGSSLMTPSHNKQATENAINNGAVYEFRWLAAVISSILMLFFIALLVRFFSKT
ncbi:hypothetical protein PVK06_037429 [Gossypium arboreum]|uniref:Uncharacterized protein n=1 Tax=Gossypium arboreum TaxID=29729 RepID=A0ABR0MZT7_GOSAR|nr:hypothetical protein PVK06_037429 [Gossypium arboreum]